MEQNFILAAIALAAVLATLPRARQRLQLSQAKHRSLGGHSRLAKRVASAIPGYAYDETRFFSADDAPADVVAQRRAGLARLGRLYAQRWPRSAAMTARAREHISDLQFTDSYRVPFQFSPYLREHLPTGSFVRCANGVMLEDLDGNRFHDLTGSYGVNVFGHDFYKQCIADGAARVAELGPVLGSYHPCVLDNVERLKAISGLDEVSFHMSGTEAVMQAVRLARYHTRKTHLVRFCGAYHGWWEDVQPGPGNPLPPRETYTLKEMDERSLRVLRTRRDIACVLVNPLQALHPNASAPGDSTLVDSSRRAGFDRSAYTAWLRRLREVCSARGIVLIFDEVFVGFRLAAGGAQQYFGVSADMVTYGKTLGGGLPVGVVCGRADLMKRYGNSLLQVDPGLNVKLVSETPLRNGTIVKVMSKIDRRSGAPVPVDYLMHRNGGQWQVFDVIVEGVSFVQTFRTQFADELRSKTLAQLTDDLRAGKIQVDASTDKK